MEHFTAGRFFHNILNFYTVVFHCLRRSQTAENRPDEGDFRTIDSTFFYYSL